MNDDYHSQVLNNNSAMAKAIENGEFSFAVKGNLGRVINSHTPFVPIGSFHSGDEKIPVGLKYEKFPSEAALFQIGLGRSVNYFDTPEYQIQRAWGNLVLFGEHQPEHISTLPRIFSLAKSKRGCNLGVLVEDISNGGENEVVDLGKVGWYQYRDSVEGLAEIYVALKEEFIDGSHGVAGAAISAVFLQKEGDVYRIRVVDTDQLNPSLKYGLQGWTRYSSMQLPETTIEFSLETLFDGNSAMLGYALDILEKLDSRETLTEGEMVHIRSPRSQGISGFQMKEVRHALMGNGNIDISEEGRSIVYHKPEVEISPTYQASLD